MFCALRLVGAVACEKEKQPNPLRVRAGINLGSVKLVRDINGNPNAVGDGINVGQRVMSFAADNQILVSRSFYEVASSLSESYAGLFKYEGVHKDKHIREHTLYELHPPEAMRSAAPTVEKVPVAASSPLTPEQKVRVETQLALILGPISRHLIRHACQHAGSAADLRQALLAFVPAKADQEKFLKGCRDVFSGTAVPLPTPPTPPEKKSASVLEPSVLESARKDLAVYIGPLARVLVDRAASKAPSKAELYQMLAGEITSAKDREAFLKQASLT